MPPIGNSSNRENSVESFLTHVANQNGLDPFKPAPSAKKIAKFLESNESINFLESQTFESKEIMKKYLEKKVQNNASGKATDKLLSFFKKIFSGNTSKNYQKALSALSSNIDASYESHKEDIQTFIEQTAPFFTDQFKTINEQEKDKLLESMLDFYLDTKQDGDSKEISQPKNINEKTFIVVKIEVETENDKNIVKKSIEIFHKPEDELAKGGFGSISPVKSNVISENAIIKEANRGTDKSIHRDAKVLKAVNKNGSQENVQEAPLAYINASEPSRKDALKTKQITKKIVSSRYDGDVENLIDQKLHSMGAKEKFSEGMKLVKQVNNGLLNLQKQNYLHTDHKLLNMLYKAEGKDKNEYRLVISDLGGDVNTANTEKYVTQFREISKQMREAKNQYQPTGDLDENQDRIVWKLLGVQSPVTTSESDNAQFEPILINPQLTTSDCAKELNLLAEKRVVYANAIVTLELLTGSNVKALNATTLFIKSLGDLDTFTKNLETFCRNNNADFASFTPAQIEILWKSLQGDYKSRPTLQEFSDAFA